MFNPWQSVKVVNTESEYSGRAGCVIRGEGQGFVVQLDDLPDGTPKALVTFAAEELVSLGM